MIPELAKAASAEDALAELRRERAERAEEQRLARIHDEVLDAFLETSDDDRLAMALRLSMNRDTPEDRAVMAAARHMFPKSVPRGFEFRRRNEPPSLPRSRLRGVLTVLGYLAVAAVTIGLLFLLPAPDRLTFDLLPKWAIGAGLVVLAGVLLAAGLPILRRPEYRGLTDDHIGPEILLTADHRAVLLDEIHGERPITRDLLPLTIPMAARQVRVGARSWTATGTVVLAAFQALIADGHHIAHQAIFAVLLSIALTSAVDDALDARRAARFLRRFG